MESLGFVTIVRLSLVSLFSFDALARSIVPECTGTLKGVCVLNTTGVEPHIMV